MGMSNPEIFGNVQMAEFQVGTHCMCCGELVILNELEAQGVCIKLCDDCKKAIKFTKWFLQKHTIRLNDEKGCIHEVQYINTRNDNGEFD